MTKGYQATRLVARSRASELVTPYILRSDYDKWPYRVGSVSLPSAGMELVRIKSAHSPARFCSFVVLLCASCGGAAPQAQSVDPTSEEKPSEAAASDPTEAERTAPDEHEIVRVHIVPTKEEQAAGGAEVILDKHEHVVHWVDSEAFSTEGWVPHVEDSVPRYHVGFEDSSGEEVLGFSIGTTNDSPVVPSCFGLCATWWVAPMKEDGSIDLERYRVMTDEIWHPLAREWYLAH